VHDAVARISISLQMPSAEAPVRKPEASRVPVEDRIREALECIESGEDSAQEWILVNKIYKLLKSKKNLGPRGRNLIKMIEPVLAHYGYHGIDSKNS